MQESFDPLIDAKMIKQSLSCPKKDMNKLINVVAHRSNEQRQLILNSFKRNYNKSLKENLKSELSGSFQKAVIALFYSPVDYDCYQINKAVKGFITDEDTLIEILATRSNNRLKEINDRYPKMYDGKNLIRVIKSETSGVFKNILVKLLKGERSDNCHPDEAECKNLAILLNDAEVKKELTEDIYIKIFTEKSREEFILITKYYYNLYKKNLLETIEHLFSGDVKKIFITITYALLSPSEYFAYRINKAINSFMTNNNMLIRVIVSRDEIDIDRIKRYYKQQFEKDLYSTIKEKINGDYRNLLIALIGK